jgi:N utilization substance protein B
VAARNKARKRAFQILFEAEQRGATPTTVMADWIRLARTDDRQPPVTDYTRRLVEGYTEHAARIDELLAGYSVGWTLDRMPVVDRNVLRLAVFELAHRSDTPVNVVIDEAIELGKKYGSESSGAFVNGVLDRIAAGLPPGRRGEG